MAAREPDATAPEPRPTSAPERTRGAKEAFDLVVVGGGIIGTGVARDAALRGWRVAVVEANDFGWGTTARSTRLIHGGLRYLEHLDLGLVREGLRERRVLMKIAPHLVQPLPFLFPVYRRRGRRKMTLRLGLFLYDLLSGRGVGDRHRWQRRAQVVRQVPALDAPGLKGAFRFFDCQVPYPERLVMENVIDVEAHGGVAWNHQEVTGLETDAGPGDTRQVRGVRIRDRIVGTEQVVEARMVLNTAGPWVTEVDSKLGCRRPALTRRTKGVHLLVDPITEHALVLPRGDGKRIIFAIPWQRYTLIGTTDTDYGGANERVRATADDVRYLLDEVNAQLGLGLRPADVHFTWAGLRALIHDTSGKEGAVSRRHLIVDHGATDGLRGLFSVVGGKITAYRAIAADIMDRLAQSAGRRGAAKTASVPLPGGAEFDEVAMLRRLGASLAHLSDPDVDRIVGLYGARAAGLVDAAQRHPERIGPIHPGSRLTWEEVAFAVEDEGARTVEDVLMRRTMAGLEADQGLPVAEGVAAYMARLLGWSRVRQEQELAEYVAMAERNRQGVMELRDAYEPGAPDVRLADRPKRRRRGRAG